MRRILRHSLSQYPPVQTGDEMYSIQRVYIQIDEEGEVQLGCVLVRFLQ